MPIRPENRGRYPADWTGRVLTAHPATYTPVIVDQMLQVLDQHPEHLTVFDPFAGTGQQLQRLAEGGRTVTGIELEPEWAACSPHVTQGDATDPASWPEVIDAVVTSPAYGNRMADQYDGRDGSRRHTYRCSLGRDLSTNSGAALQWGDAYRELHATVWAIAAERVNPGGLVIVNVKNHIRHHQVQRVVEWHLTTLLGLGLGLVEARPIRTPGQRMGANGAARVDHEHLLVLEVK